MSDHVCVERLTGQNDVTGFRRLELERRRLESGARYKLSRFETRRGSREKRQQWAEEETKRGEHTENTAEDTLQVWCWWFTAKHGRVSMRCMREERKKEGVCWMPKKWRTLSARRYAEGKRQKENMACRKKRRQQRMRLRCEGRERELQLLNGNGRARF